MKVVLRVDDYGWSPREATPSPMKAPDDGLRLAQGFHAALGGLPYLAAVIPAAVDERGLEWLQSEPSGLTIALHGWSHRPAGGGVHSEFHDFDEAGCRALLDQGQRMLRTAAGPPRHFVPPFNAMEPALVDALWHEGLRYVWGAPSAWPTPPQPYDLERLTFIRAWAPLYGASVWRQGPQDRPLLEVWQEVREWPGKAVMTLHLPWEYARNPGLDGLRRLVEAIGPAVIGPEEFLA